MTDPSNSFPAHIQTTLDQKTKPPGSLGRLETLAAQIALIQHTLSPQADRCRLTIFAADHGMALAGVSAFPQSVTRQMVQNFLAEGAAANVFARSLGADLHVVDAGVAGPPLAHPALLSRRLGAGTANAIEEPAMTPACYQQGLQQGHEIGASGDHPVACFGEMGIGNTAASSLVAAKLLGCPVAELVGRGTGLDDAGLARKRSLLETAAARTPSPLDAPQALQEYSGFEMVMMAGAMLGAAEAGKIIIVDGFIASVVALAVQALSADTARAMVFAHRSAEAGHTRVLEALGAEPLLDLGLRLGEGTGALLAWPLVKAAAAMLREMASFDSAQIDGPV